MRTFKKVIYFLTQIFIRGNFTKNKSDAFVKDLKHTGNQTYQIISCGELKFSPQNIFVCLA